MTSDDPEAFLAELERSETIHAKNNQHVVPSGERPCPICGKHMEVDEMSGINIDYCGEHGVWLDRGELPTILSNSKASLRRGKAEAVRRARLQGKKSGVMFGVWSFLWD